MMADYQGHRAQARVEMMHKLLEAGTTSNALEKLTGKELAGLIQEHLMGDLDMTEPAFLLLDEACQRLEKA